MKSKIIYETLILQNFQRIFGIVINEQDQISQNKTKFFVNNRRN